MPNYNLRQYTYTQEGPYHPQSRTTVSLSASYNTYCQLFTRSRVWVTALSDDSTGNLTYREPPFDRRLLFTAPQSVFGKQPHKAKTDVSGYCHRQGTL